MTQPSVPGPVIRPPEAEAALADATTSPQLLALIAAQYPSLRDRIAQHPQAYPALVEWLAAAGPESSPPPPPTDPGPPIDPGPATEPAPSRRWPWITAIVAVVVVAALVVAVIVWRPWTSAPAPHASASKLPNRATAPATPAGSEPSSATAPSSQSGMVSDYAGTAVQNGGSFKAWQVRIALYQGYGLIDYNLGKRTCSGVLLRNADGAWRERITQGTCDDGGLWSLSGMGSDKLTGSYQPPQGSYTVLIDLPRSTQRSSGEISEAVPTQGCTTDPAQPISTIVVIDKSAIGLVAHPGSDVWVLRGPRKAPQQKITLTAGDDGVDVDFASGTSNHATVVIDC